MKIECNDNLFGMPIEDIKVGECFYLKGELHMKINKNGYTKIVRSKAYPNVVLNLFDNKLNFIADGVTVSKVDAKIVVG